MSRYIDADVLVDDLIHNRGFYPAMVSSAIKNTPTADVVEVRHGEWIEKDDGFGGVYYDCTACGCSWTTIDGTPFDNNMKYCPECGAKMDGERIKE